MIETVNCGGSAPDGAGFLFLPGPVPILYQAGEIQLAEGLIGYRRHGVGQVQARASSRMGRRTQRSGYRCSSAGGSPAVSFPKKSQQPSRYAASLYRRADLVVVSHRSGWGFRAKNHPGTHRRVRPPDANNRGPPA